MLETFKLKAQKTKKLFNYGFKTKYRKLTEILI